MAKRLRPFEPLLIAYSDVGEDASDAGQALGLEPMSLAGLLASCDVVSVHVSLTETIRGLIGGDELALMPTGSILVNAFRGGAVDEVDLYLALSARRLKGAALDVFAHEPPPDVARWAPLDNVLSRHTWRAARTRAERRWSAAAWRISRPGSPESGRPTSSTASFACRTTCP